MSEKTTESIVLCPKCGGRKKYAEIDSSHSSMRETFYKSYACENCNKLGVVLQTTTVKQTALTDEEFDKLPISGMRFIEYEDWINPKNQ